MWETHNAYEITAVAGISRAMLQLTNEFRATVERLAPKTVNRLTEEMMHEAVEEMNAGMKTHQFGKWRDGETFREETHVKIVKAIFHGTDTRRPTKDGKGFEVVPERERSGQRPFREFQNIILAYVKKKGVDWPLRPDHRPEQELWQQVDPDAVIRDCVAIVRAITVRSDEAPDDWDAMIGNLQTRKYKKRLQEGELCEPLDPEAVNEAVESIFTITGRDHANDPKLGRRRAMEVAAEHYKFSPVLYAEKVREWRDACPWSVVGVIKGRRYVSYCILLPLTDDAYDRLRSGKIDSIDLTKDDLLLNSDRIWVEAVCRRPQDMEGLKTGWKPLEQCAVAQQLRTLSTIEQLVFGTRPLRMLAPEATKENTSRSRMLDFKRVEGVTIPGSGLGLGELVIRPPEGDDWKQIAFAYLVCKCLLPATELLLRRRRR